MPTYSLDEGFFEEYEIPINESEWTRGPGGTYVGFQRADPVQLDLDQLEGGIREVWAALVSAGATQLRCAYDGGGDEGFAHFESALIAGETLNINDLAAQFSQGALGEATAASLYANESRAGHSPHAMAKDALDFLAYVLAAKLLGKGFGTGVEGDMYGAFLVDLGTGEITDEPTAAPG